MDSDSFIVLSGFLSFFVFLILHTAIFRFVSSGGVLKWLMNVLFLSVAFNVFLTFNFVHSKSISLTGIAVIGCTSLVIFGILAFLYILCIFGPFESSIRMRLIRELALAHPRGLTYKEMRAHYNAHVILQRRLDRLLTSGDLRFENSLYSSGKRFNFFLIKDFLGEKIQRIIGS